MHIKKTKGKMAKLIKVARMSFCKFGRGTQHQRHMAARYHNVIVPKAVP